MKKVFALLVLMISTTFFIGCGTKALSENYNEDELRKVTEELIVDFNKENYKSFEEKGIKEFKENKNQLEEAKGLVDEKVGKYQGISNITLQEKQGIAMVLAKGNHEKGQILYQLTFDEEMTLTNFFIR